MVRKKFTLFVNTIFFQPPHLSHTKFYSPKMFNQCLENSVTTSISGAEDDFSEFSTMIQSLKIDANLISNHLDEKQGILNTQLNLLKKTDNEIDQMLIKKEDKMRTAAKIKPKLEIKQKFAKPIRISSMIEFLSIYMLSRKPPYQVGSHGISV